MYTITQVPLLNPLVGSTGYGPNVTTATTMTQRQRVRTNTNTTESEIKVFSQNQLHSQVNIDLASTIGTPITATNPAQQDRPVQMLRPVKQAHRSENAIQNRKPLNAPSYSGNATTSRPTRSRTCKWRPRNDPSKPQQQHNHTPAQRDQPLAPRENH
jgi:hypothetical protein